MRVMAILIAGDEPPSGSPDGRRRLAEMGQFDEQLVNAGVLLAGERLEAGATAVRVRIADGRRVTIDRPFGGAVGAIAGFWLWQVRSIDEAVEWATRSPAPAGGAMEIEIRRVVEPADPNHAGRATGPMAFEGE